MAKFARQEVNGDGAEKTVLLAVGSAERELDLPLMLISENMFRTLDDYMRLDMFGARASWTRKRKRR